MGVIIPELESLKAKEIKAGVWEVERGAIVKLAQAIDDPNPLWQDERFARKTRYGGIIAPPTFVLSLGIQDLLNQVLMVDLPLTRTLDGGLEIEFFEFIKPGDIITTSGRLKEVREKESRLGKMLLLISEATLINQFDETVAKVTCTTIKY